VISPERVISLCDLVPNLADFAAISPRHVDRRKCCRLSSATASLLQRAFTFVYNTFAWPWHTASRGSSATVKSRH